MRAMFSSSTLELVCTSTQSSSLKMTMSIVGVKGGIKSDRKINSVKLDAAKQ